VSDLSTSGVRPDAPAPEVAAAGDRVTGAAFAPAPARADFSAAQRLAMVGMGYIPLLHAAAVVAFVVLPLTGVLRPAWAWAAPAALYLLPPLVVRAVCALKPLPAGSVGLNTGGFLRWWFTSQWQAVFNRLPVLEEMLRLIPGVYAAWLRLWGARVGRLLYASPGVRVSDRPLLRLGHRVVLGAGARLNAHMIAAPAGAASPRAVLVLAPITVGDGAVVGGYATVGPGVVIAPGEITHATLILPPFSRWEHGRRRRPERPARGPEGSDAPCA
jgi:hypothetical protein